ncbi:TPA: hypothetical protein ENS27_08285, partial [bacterium]|nr:hypothetical protein [bacterium]
IISESGIASGIRRIEAVTGDGARKYVNERISQINTLDKEIDRMLVEQNNLERQLGRQSNSEKAKGLSRINLQVEKLSMNLIDEIEKALFIREERIKEVTKTINDLRKEISSLRVEEAGDQIDSLVKGGVVIDNIKIISGRVNVINNDELKKVGDTLRMKLVSGVGVLGTILEDKVALVCVVTDNLIKEKKLNAGQIVGKVAKLVGGGGGGKPHLATAGGKDISRLDDALKGVSEIVRELLNK